MTEKDLFGNEVNYHHQGNGKRGRNANPKGYAARPGTGPDGETCKSCRFYHVTNTQARRSYRKCELLRWRWTHGPGTDILAGSPACERWQPWETIEFAGVIIKAHPQFEPMESRDGGKTWQTISSGKPPHAGRCFVRVHRVFQHGLPGQPG